MSTSMATQMIILMLFTLRLTNCKPSQMQIQRAVLPVLQNQYQVLCMVKTLVRLSTVSFSILLNATCQSMYLQDPNTFPAIPETRRQNIRRMIDVCIALERLGKTFTYDKRKDRLASTSYYHCDLKPSNILVYVEHGRISFKVADFGQTQGVQSNPQSEPRPRAWKMIGKVHTADRRI